MSTLSENLDFFQEMAAQLDDSIQKLELREQQLERMLGPDRVDELHEILGFTFDDLDVSEVQRAMDARDQEFLTVLVRKERAHAQRLMVGRQMMRQSFPDVTECGEA